jgi:hypothetical protein
MGEIGDGLLILLICFTHMTILFAKKTRDLHIFSALAARCHPQRRQAIAPRTACQLPKLRGGQLPRGVAVELPGDLPNVGDVGVQKCRVLPGKSALLMDVR